jgi:hypothetical protein
MQACCGSLDTATRGFEPVAKSVAQANLELIGFWNRRAQAWLEMPSRYSQCRTPQDVFAENIRFMQTALAQYQDSSRKLMKFWAQAVPDIPLPSPAKSKVERDYFSIPEHHDEAHRRESGNGRRAA